MAKAIIKTLNPAIRGFESPVKLHKTPSGDRIQLPFSEWVVDGCSNVEVLHVRDFRTLVQVLNKAKYADGIASDGDRVTYFRGQARLFNGTLKPSVYRRLNKKNPRSNVDGRIVAELRKITIGGGKNVAKLTDPVVEGLFQQYEHSSRWIDAVDNVWIALWFACHERWEEGGKVCYLLRNPSQEKEKYRYAYILLLGAERGGKIVAGHWRGKHSERVDLRYAVSSHFVRPHVQHGVLVRALNKTGAIMEDMTSLIRGVVRISLSDALRWMGNAESFEVSNVFPNPSFDTGLRDLIEDGKKVGIDFR